MPFIFFNEEVNLDKYPVIRPCQGKLIIGDIHGNAHFLLYVLVAFGYLEITEDQFHRLIEIYKTPVDELSAQQVLYFRRILSKVDCRGNDLLLLGDVLSDRGNNDYFTVCLLRKLHRSHIPFSILEGNHDFEFLECYEKGRHYRKTYYTAKRIQKKQTCSINNLQKLLDKHLTDSKGSLAISAKRFRSWIRSYLIDHYKALDYSLGENDIIIYSHAPIDIGIIAGIATEFDVEFNDESPAALALSIDRINKHFNSLLHARTLSRQFHSMHSNESKTSPAADVLTRLIWNRDYQSLDRAPRYKDYYVGYCHGHDSNSDPHSDNTISLDKKLGKSARLTKGQLMLLIERRHPGSSGVDDDRLSFFNQLKPSLVKHQVQDVTLSIR